MRAPLPRSRSALGVLAAIAVTSACGAADDSADADNSITAAPVTTLEIAEPRQEPSMNPPESAPTASDSPPIDPTATDVACRRLTDFVDESEPWFIVNDGVMGGRSNGSATVGDSALRFTGTVVTDGGGFTSVRRSLVGGGGLAGSDRVDLRVRADSRVYGLILDDRHEIDGRNVSFRADLDTTGTVDGDGWQIVSVAYADLTPTIFGRVVDAGPFVPAEATEIGIIIADAVDGDFALDVDWIDACGEVVEASVAGA